MDNAFAGVPTALAVAGVVVLAVLPLTLALRPALESIRIRA
jgi:hypothetical protein